MSDRTIHTGYQNRKTVYGIITERNNSQYRNIELSSKGVNFKNWCTKQNMSIKWSNGSRGSLKVVWAHWSLFFSVQISIAKICWLKKAYWSSLRLTNCRGSLGLRRAHQGSSGSLETVWTHWGSFIFFAKLRPTKFLTKGSYKKSDSRMVYKKILIRFHKVVK